MPDVKDIEQLFPKNVLKFRWGCRFYHY